MNTEITFPWIFNNGETDRKCVSYMSGFMKTGLIHQRCRHYCWKLKIIPSTINELLRLERYLRAYNKIAKCGVELRAYGESKYAGFIYFSSLKEALSRILYIPFENKKILRGCTEMRMKIPLDQWDLVSRDRLIKGKYKPVYQPQTQIRRTKKLWKEMS